MHEYSFIQCYGYVYLNLYLTSYYMSGCIIKRQFIDKVYHNSWHSLQHDVLV